MCLFSTTALSNPLSVAMVVTSLQIEANINYK